MPLALARVDDRLIHGQIVQSWLPNMKVDEVLIVSESASKDKMRQKLMRVSLPADFSLEIMDEQTAADYIKQSNKNIFLIAHTISEIISLINLGIKFVKVNIGGIHYAQGKEQITKNLFLDEQDKENIKILLSEGIKVETNSVPDELSVDIRKNL